MRELHLTVKAKAPNIVFLIKRREKVERVRNQIGYDQSFVIDSRGCSGGLAMFWNSSILVEVYFYTNSHISVNVTNTDSGGKKWLLIGFYGNPITVKRLGSWQLLRALKPLDNRAWMCMGDFNKILQQHEKYGGPARPYSQMESFRQAMKESDLSDLVYQGHKYTWSNN